MFLFPLSLFFSLLVYLEFIGQRSFKFMCKISTFLYLHTYTHTHTYIYIYIYISKVYLSFTLEQYSKRGVRILCQTHEIWQMICASHYMTSHLRPDSPSGIFFESLLLYFCVHFSYFSYVLHDCSSHYFWSDNKRLDESGVNRWQQQGSIK